jgi:hypothetical protein
VPEREREQRVAGEDGDGLAVDDVAGGLAAAEVVVVHAGEVVMDEGHGVHHLEGRGGGGGGRGTAGGGAQASRPPAMPHAARHSAGRTRFPPASSAYRIASWSAAGGSPVGMAASRARFTAAARSPMYALKSNSVVAEAAAVATMAEKRRRGAVADADAAGPGRSGERWTREAASGWKAIAMGGEIGRRRRGDWRWPREVAISLS